MAQTLLGLLALVLASLVSFNQQRNSSSNYELMVQNEIEMAASGTIMRIMELIGSRSFDERSTPAGIDARNYLPEFDDDFVDVEQFGEVDRGASGCDLIEPFRTPDCDDVDDLSGLRSQLVNAELSTGRYLAFDVDVDVQYVKDGEASDISEIPTLHKLVEVRVESDYLPNGAISIQRVISYDPIKAELEYEEVYGPLEGGGEPYGEGGDCGGEIC